MALVTVLMCSYNHEKYLAEAIESVLNQTFSDLELIIVDDYSTDRSTQIILEYQAKDSRVKPIFHERNLGIARSTNDALKEAKGKFVAFIGSDDVWYPNKLRHQLKILEKNEDKIIWSEGQIIDGNSVLTGQTVTKLLGSPRKKSGNLFQALLFEDFIFGQSAIFRIEYAKETAFDEHFRYVNDHLFFITLSLKRDFLFLPQPLAKYRIHGQNATLKNRDQWFRERIVLRNMLLKLYGNRISARSMADIYYKMGHAYAGLGQKDSAKKCYLKAIRADPFRSHSLLFLILALTNGEGFLGNFLQSGYNKLASFGMQVTFD